MLALYITFFAACFFVSPSWSVTIEERLESIKSNQTFMQQWKEHIKLWQHDDQSTYGSEISCSIDDSWHIPRSVHELRPADIGIVGAMGASIMAGMGAGADSLFSLLLEYRGLSYAIGGDGDLSNMVTVPNILKQFNNDIFGQSYRIAPVWYEKFSQLNIAKPGAKSADLKDQVKELVRRVEQVPGHEHKWKLITLNIGTNDVCHFCNERKSSPQKWIKDYKAGLDKLRSRLSKTFVNLVPLISLETWRGFQKQSPVCDWFYQFECPCLDHPQAVAHQAQFNHMLTNLAEEYVGHDFTVEVQPFWQRAEQRNASKAKAEETVSTASNLAYMAPDCFHLSQLGHASAALALWNNMVEYEEEKSNAWDLGNRQLACPDADCPFLRTRRNSIRCARPKNESSEETPEFPWSSEEDNSTDTWFHRPTPGESSEEDEDWDFENRTRRPHDEDWGFENRTHRPHRTRATHDFKRNHTRIITRQPDGMVTATQSVVMARQVQQPVQQSSSVLAWVFVGILGSVSLLLLTLLIAQKLAQKRKDKVRGLLTEKSPLLPPDEDQMY